MDKFERSMASTGRILSLLKIKKTVKENDESQDLINPKANIKLDNIHFIYPNKTAVFDDFSC